MIKNYNFNLNEYKKHSSFFLNKNQVNVDDIILNKVKKNKQDF